MNSIGNIAKGIFIGDGALAAFKEISRNKEIKSGLFDKTTDSSVRKYNTNNNFPRTASYYYTLQKLGEKPMELKRFFFGNLVSGDNIDGLDIGWAYTTDVNQTRLHGGSYASSADFDEFQRLLRGEALTRGTLGAKGQNIHVNTRYSDYNITNHTIEKYENDENWGARSLNIGDSYVVGKDTTYNIKHKVLKKTHDDYAWIKRDNFYTLPNKDNVFLNSHYLKENVNGSQGNEILKYTKSQSIKRKEYKTIDEIQELITPNLKASINNVVNEYGNKTTIYDYKLEFLVNSDFQTQFKLKEFKLEDLKSFINENNKGLKDYSLKYRSYNEESTTSLLTQTNRSSIHRYKKESQYGLSSKDVTNSVVGPSSATVSTSRFYNINDNLGNKLTEDFKIDTNEFGEHDDSPYYKKETDNIISASTNGVGLLKYTENLFRNCKINSLVNRFHTNITQTGEKETLSRGRNLKSKKSTTINDYDNPYCRVWTATHQYSTMKDVIRPFYENEQVISLTDIQKKISTSMRPNNGAEKLGNNSVLQDNGFVRITPQITKKGEIEGIKRYMFSIENLAWKDKNKILTKEQSGPNGGRIMWFPPYNLKFSENINVNWNGNNFIGRGEQIYTYTNTERSGTLDFTLLIDHPSILNEWRGTGDGKNKSEEELLRFFAGCGMLNKDSSIKETTLNREPDTSTNNIKKSTVEAKTKTDESSEETDKGLKFDAKLIDGAKRVAYVIFFPNAFPLNGRMYKDAGKNLDMLRILKELCVYETSSNGEESMFASEGTKNKNKFSLNLNTNNCIDDIKKAIGGNPDDLDVKYLIDDIIKEKVTTSSTEVKYNTDSIKGNKLFNYDLSKYDIKLVEYHSTATKVGSSKLNKQLTTNRLTLIKELLNKIGIGGMLNGVEIVDKPSAIVDVNDKDTVNSKEAKYGRIGLVIISLAPKTDLKPESEPLSAGSTVVNNREIKNAAAPPAPASTQSEGSVTNVVIDAVSRVENEFLYFTEISRDEEIIQSILQRIRHFDPAFHSLTPEGFNARLTFLQQCTRQGPTAEFGSNNSQGGSANFVKTASNLSFGRAPYCILRIGDFFNTKICIDSISINYDNGGGPQWDLNPEGTGVQPMFANISINFKFLGGQDIAGPVEKLQNAITSNYYANASVYDVNAEDGKNKK